MPKSVVARFDFNLLQMGVNTIWSPVNNRDVGAERLYSKVEGSVPLGNCAVIGSNGAAISSIAGGSSDIWSGGMRVQ